MFLCRDSDRPFTVPSPSCLPFLSNAAPVPSLGVIKLPTSLSFLKRRNNKTLKNAKGREGDVFRKIGGGTDTVTEQKCYLHCNWFFKISLIAKIKHIYQTPLIPLAGFIPSKDLTPLTSFRHCFTKFAKFLDHIALI